MRFSEFFISRPIFAGVLSTLIFLAGLILLWQASIGWFRIPAYILQRPSDIVINSLADLPRLLNYTAVTASETPSAASSDTCEATMTRNSVAPSSSRTRSAAVSPADTAA